MKLIQCAALFAIATPAIFAVSLRADCIPVKVVVITTFQSGKDNDPTAGEFGNWVLNLPLSVTIPFPQGYHHLRYNPELQVLGIVTGEGKSHAAASIMGLGMDPRFDLSKAYWIIAAIAGVNPNKGSVASTLVLRSASDYTAQPQGKTPAQFLASENSGGLSGFLEALSNVYQVGSTVVKKISSNWDTYKNHIPSPGSLGASPTVTTK